MKLCKFIEQLQEISDQYNGKVDVVIEYKLKNKVMISSRPKVYTKCIYYKKPKQMPYGQTKIGKICIVLSNRVMLYNDYKAPIKGYKLGENSY